jgi:hypothetical protein
MAIIPENPADLNFGLIQKGNGHANSGNSGAAIPGT